MYIYGKNPVMEAIKANKQIKKVFVQDNSEVLNKMQQFCLKNHLELTILSSSKLKELFGANHQGLVIEVNDYQYVALDDLLKTLKAKDNATVAILDGLEDPHNLGAIMRTADATAIDGIIIPKNRSVSLNATVAKVSTGAIEYVKVSKVTNLVQAINKLKDAGFWIVGLDMDGARDYKDYDYLGKTAIVIGSEGFGLSRLVKENCDLKISIPMLGHVTSLNASVSASIIFYEILRKRHQ